MAEQSQPTVVILAGANGAGKTTAAPYLLRDEMGIKEFVNADVIAQGLSGFNPAAVNFEAGAIMLRRLRKLSNERQSFAFETTLASRSFVPWLRELDSNGYLIDLNFLWLPSPDMAVQRVRERVKHGGHSVPESVIRRRFDRGLGNFFNLYMPIAHDWAIYDNSLATARIVAHGNQNRESVLDPECWTIIRRQANKS